MDGNKNQSSHFTIEASWLAGPFVTSAQPGNLSFNEDGFQFTITDKTERQYPISEIKKVVVSPGKISIVPKQGKRSRFLLGTIASQSETVSKNSAISAAKSGALLSAGLIPMGSASQERQDAVNKFKESIVSYNDLLESMVASLRAQGVTVEGTLNIKTFNLIAGLILAIVAIIIMLIVL